MPKQHKRQIGIVLKRMKGFYYVDIEGTVHLCRIKGNLFQEKSQKNAVAVGDQVEVDLAAAEDTGWIYKILPRHSQLSRPAKESRIEQTLVSNVENLLIVCSVKNPPFRVGMVDRFLITAQRGNLKPTIILNKIDLAAPQETYDIQKTYQDLGYEVLLTSVVSQTGLAAFQALLKEQTSVLSGHSGVGKSSLLKALFPEWEIKIGRLSNATQKGKHTTTLAEMYRLPTGGYVVDTPGIRELGIHQLSREELEQFFVEFEEARWQCRFKGCTHRHEPDCGVKAAVADQHITQRRYESYCSIFDSMF